MPSAPDQDPITLCGLSMSGGGLTLWSASDTLHPDTDTNYQLALRPDERVVVGRQQGGDLEYLDPSCRPTQLLPNTFHSVLTQRPLEDSYVSRGHFTLLGVPHGLVL